MQTTAEAPVNQTVCSRVPMGGRPQLAFFNMAEFTVEKAHEEMSRTEKVIAERKKNTEARNEKIRERFNHLYNVERKRPDDVINTLAEEFCLAKSTIESALKG